MIRCFYSKIKRKDYDSRYERDKRRANHTSLKKQCSCPFQSRYSYLEYQHKNHIPTSLYKIKITECNYNHTYQLSSIFYKTANLQLHGTCKLNLNGMNSILILFKSNPATYASSLRPILMEYVHRDIPLDTTYIRNFRQRVALFHTKNPTYKDISTEEANMLLEPSPVTEDESKIL